MRVLTASAAVLTAILFLTQAAAAPPRVRSDIVIHEKRTTHSSSWVKRDRIPAESNLPVRIGLAQSNLEHGYDFLMDVSHPSSPNYGKHWTADQVHEMFAPSEETISTVRGWLIDSGIAKDRILHSGNKGMIAFDATAEEVESLFTAEYYTFEHSSSGKSALACDEYHLPSYIQEHVDYITPGVQLISPKNRAKRSVPSTGGPSKLVPRPSAANNDYNISSLENCDVLITPACIKALYHIPEATKANTANVMGILEGTGNSYDQPDLDAFFINYSPNIPQGTHPQADLIDGAAPVPVPVDDAGVEGLLDFELAYPILYPQNLVLYQMPDDWSFNTFLDAIDASYCTYSAYGETGDDPNYDPSFPAGEHDCGTYTATNVISTSYGAAEYDIPEYYTKRQCNEYMKLGLQGHTFLYSSGDFGVGGFPDDDEAPTGCLGPNGTIFNPQTPVDCPYVTAVGATKVYPGHTVFEPESAANDPINDPYTTAYSSGGGFSNFFDAPDYQKEALATYFAEHDPPYRYYYGNASFGANGGVYNRIGRGIPDVSANGDNTAIYIYGGFFSSGGTSAATPIFASVINLINEERLAIGKSPVGFINPVLYTYPWILNDITNGTNPNCDTDGFSAVRGWDPITGLGTPNYPKMLELFLSLP